MSKGLDSKNIASAYFPWYELPRISSNDFVKLAGMKNSIIGRAGSWRDIYKIEPDIMFTSCDRWAFLEQPLVMIGSFSILAKHLNDGLEALSQLLKLVERVPYWDFLRSRLYHNLSMSKLIDLSGPLPLLTDF